MYRQVNILKILGGSALMLAAQSVCFSKDGVQRPNIVIILADDLGYGDLGCYGHPTIKTPNLDRMADEGMRMTQFYSAAGVSTPSRAALLTGRYPVRIGMYGDKYSVLYWDVEEGLPTDEVTFAQIAQDSGYSTACIGKWHLGKQSPYLPCDFGFDYWFGVPFANNFKPLPLMESTGKDDLKCLEENADQRYLTRQYTEHAVQFIEDHKDEPFLIYYALNAPHTPLFTSETFTGKSRRGAYGDVVEELDWSVGQILKKLKETGIDDNTLVVFTSDNGPWFLVGLRGGSAGLLRGGKGSAWEGGFRVPAIFRYPSVIKPGTTCYNMASLMDLFNTVVSLCGGTVPQDRIIDGVDLTPLMENPKVQVRKNMQFWCGSHLRAVRQGQWKLVYEPYEEYFIEHGLDPEHMTPLLFNIEQDPSETLDYSAKRPGIFMRLTEFRDSCAVNTVVAPSVCDRRPVEND